MILCPFQIQLSLIMKVLDLFVFTNAMLLYHANEGHKIDMSRMFAAKLELSTRTPVDLMFFLCGTLMAQALDSQAAVIVISI